MNADLDFIHKLEQAKDASNVHTINKAITYYKLACQKDSSSWVNTIELVGRRGLQTGDWKDLQVALQDLW